MGLIDRFIRWACTDSVFDNLDETQSLAIVDALVLAMTVDGDIRKEERKELDRKLHELPWVWEKGLRTKERVSEEVQRSALRVNAAATGGAEALAAFARGVAAKLPDRPLREKVYGHLLYVLHSDDTVPAEETALIDAFRQAFAISSERAKQITDDVKLVLRVA